MVLKICPPPSPCDASIAKRSANDVPSAEASAHEERYRLKVTPKARRVHSSKFRDFVSLDSICTTGSFPVPGSSRSPSAISPWISFGASSSPTEHALGRFGFLGPRTSLSPLATWEDLVGFNWRLRRRNEYTRTPPLREMEPLDALELQHWRCLRPRTRAHVSIFARASLSFRDDEAKLAADLIQATRWNSERRQGRLDIIRRPRPRGRARLLLPLRR